MYIVQFDLIQSTNLLFLFDSLIEFNLRKKLYAEMHIKTHLGKAFDHTHDLRNVTVQCTCIQSPLICSSVDPGVRGGGHSGDSATGTFPRELH